jgi:hypothetical protein
MMDSIQGIRKRFLNREEEPRNLLGDAGCLKVALLSRIGILSLYHSS